MQREFLNSASKEINTFKFLSKLLNQITRFLLYARYGKEMLCHNACKTNCSSNISKSDKNKG